MNIFFNIPPFSKKYIDTEFRKKEISRISTFTSNWKVGEYTRYVEYMCGGVVNYYIRGSEICWFFGHYNIDGIFCIEEIFCLDDQWKHIALTASDPILFPRRVCLNGKDIYPWEEIYTTSKKYFKTLKIRTNSILYDITNISEYTKSPKHFIAFFLQIS